MTGIECAGDIVIKSIGYSNYILLVWVEERIGGDINRY